MNHLFKERPLLKTGILGLLLIPFVVLINEYSPSKEKIPPGYDSTILAFEYVSDINELNEVLDPLNESEIKDLDMLNYIDFGFMAVYGAFLFLFMSRLGGILQSQLLLRMRWIVPFAVISDLFENVQLLKLSRQYVMQNADHHGAITLLGIFTWLKWGMLALVLCIIGWVMLKMQKSKWAGFLLLAPVIFGCVALISGDRSVENLFATTVFLGFFVVFLYCFSYRKTI